MKNSQEEKMIRESVKTLQTMLVNEGVLIGEDQIDGDLGPKTRAAINELNIPDYLKIAMNEIGVYEIKGYAKHNPRVIYYHSFTAGKYSDDETAWCGSFVAMCMSKAGYKLPSYPERSLSWLNFGKNGDVPKVGSIAVKTRSGGGHVGFVVSVDGDYVYILGGNQNDEVNIKRYRTDAFIDFRLPMNYGNYYANLKVAAPGAGREA